VLSDISDGVERGTARLASADLVFPKVAAAAAPKEGKMRETATSCCPDKTV